MSTVAAAWIATTAAVAPASAREPAADVSATTEAPAAAEGPGACAAVTSNETVNDELERAMSAYDDLDVEQFTLATNAALAAVACLGETLDRAGAAELHRAAGMLAFVEHDEEGSKRSFAAARALEPAYVFPTSRVPEGNPLRIYYDALDPQLLAVELAPWPREGSVRLDGSADRARRIGLPVVFQRLDRDGAVEVSTLVGPSDPLPAYPIRTTDPNAKGPRKSTLIAGIAVGVLAGGTYGGALLSEQAYEDADQPETLGGRRAVTNGLVVTSGGLGAVAVGLGALSVFQGRF